jgi:xanthine dehydrogenase accessory factor
MKSYGELRDLARAWRGLEDDPDQRAALATIVRTTGSTFRRVGAAMLVHADGSVVNPLAGGCPQRAIVERSLQVIASGRVAYAGFSAEEGMDVLLDAGCGGELEVVIEPLGATRPGFVTALDAHLAAGSAFRIVTCFPPAGAVSLAERTVAGWNTMDAATTARDHAESEPWAGGVRLVETFDAPITLLIAGACHEARELASLAAGMGWHGAIVDNAPERLEHVAHGLPPGWQGIVAQPGQVAAEWPVHGSTAWVSMMHNLDADIAFLRAGAASGGFYLGALGSQMRARTIASAVASPALHVPAGLDIGSNTSREIALSIVAEIMAIRHRRDGGPLSEAGGPIH